MSIENMAVRDRIEEIRKLYQWTENSIAPDAATQKRLNRQLSHGGTISLDTILLILKACPDVSADWLLLGRGEMRSGGEASECICYEPSAIALHEHTTDRFLSLLEQKDIQINRLLALLEKLA